ncbi:transposase [Escherichia coli]
MARSYAGAGLLAHTVTGKYADHLPLYRQSERTTSPCESENTKTKLSFC